MTNEASRIDDVVDEGGSEVAPSAGPDGPGRAALEASGEAVGAESLVVPDDAATEEDAPSGARELPPPPRARRRHTRPTGAVAVAPDPDEREVLVEVTPADPDAEPDEVPDIWADLEAGPAPFAQMRFVDVAVALPNTNPVIVLEEVSLPTRLLRIPVGQPEGVSIAYAARGIATPKPLTHDLFMSTLEAYGVTVDAVRITSVRQSAFTAEIVFSGSRGVRTLGCRPSDGIALALRQRLGAPIMVAPEVLDQVGITPGS